MSSGLSAEGWEGWRSVEQSAHRLAVALAALALQRDTARAMSQENVEAIALGGASG
jgi:hypothetical protein